MLPELFLQYGRWAFKRSRWLHKGSATSNWHSGHPRCVPTNTNPLNVRHRVSAGERQNALCDFLSQFGPRRGKRRRGDRCSQCKAMPKGMRIGDATNPAFRFFFSQPPQVLRTFNKSRRMWTQTALEHNFFDPTPFSMIRALIAVF